MKISWLIFIFTLIVFSTSVYSATNTLNITITESVSQKYAYNPQQGEYFSGNTSWNSSYELEGLQMYGTINITHVGSTDISDLNITLNGTDYLTSWPNLIFAPAYLTSQSGPISRSSGIPAPGEKWWVYITTLKAGDSIIYNYTMSLTGEEPVNITQIYSTDRIIEGGMFNVTLSVKNSLSKPINVSKVTIIKNPKGYYDQDANIVFFNYTSILGPDSANAYLEDYASDYKKLIWNVSNHNNISPYYLSGQTHNITINIKAPARINGSFPTATSTWENETWGAYMLIGEIVINLSMQESLSLLAIESVKGHSIAKISVTKERVNSTHWNTSLSFNNSAPDISYNLSRVNIWSTNFSLADINPTQNIIPESNVTLYPNQEVENYTSWAGLSKTFAWDYIPVVWGDAVYHILDDGTQIQKLTKTISKDGYIYMEEIYVLKGGYLIKATKQIRPLTTTQNAYNVTLVLENVGTEKTPDWISVFDLIPPGFSLADYDDPTTNHNNRNISEPNSFSVKNISLLRGTQNFAPISGGSYDNYSGYRIDFYELLEGSTGNGAYDQANSEILFQYILIGEGNLSRVGNAFLVGVDPQRTQGQISSTAQPNTNIKIKLKDNKFETISVFLSVIVACFAIFSGLYLRNRSFK